VANDASSSFGMAQRNSKERASIFLGTLKQYLQMQTKSVTAACVELMLRTAQQSQPIVSELVRLCKVTGSPFGLSISS